MAYADYWRRIKATIIDCILVAIAYAVLFLLAKSWVVYLMTFSKTQAEHDVMAQVVIYGLTGIGLAIDMWIFVVMPSVFGGTPGQFFSGLRMAMKDSTKASLNAIMLKHCVSFILLCIVLINFWTNALVPYLASDSGVFDYIVTACYGWLFLNLFIMACNTNNRSMSDYISDTAVVNKGEIKPGYIYTYVGDTLTAVPAPIPDVKVDINAEVTDEGADDNTVDNAKKNDIEASQRMPAPVAAAAKSQTKAPDKKVDDDTKKT